ncbi:MAG TPA: hypothetical protein VL983_00465, partial [Terriglobales bacterium]|nr:hypothetical protein [Terriglobales bacterium]
LVCLYWRICSPPRQSLTGAPGSPKVRAAFPVKKPLREKQQAQDVQMARFGPWLGRISVPAT